MCIRDSYTSGSTGKPKGAMITHRNIVNFLTWVKEKLGITAAERLAFVTSYAFDMTMTSNWTPFLVGASLHVLSEENTKDVNNLLRFISEKGITFLNITPSHFSLLSSAREFLADADIPLPETMRIMLGGEVISTKDLNQWLKFYPGHRFINEDVYKRQQQNRTAGEAGGLIIGRFFCRKYKKKIRR